MKPLFYLLCLTSIAGARLGETREQSAARYGAAIETGAESTIHEHDGQRVELLYGSDGKAREVRFAKLPSIMAGRYSPMTPALITEHLQNAQAGEWQRLPGRVVKETWTSPDGQLQAIFDHRLKILAISPVQ